VELKRRVWELVETAEGDDLSSRLVDLFIITLIIANVIVVILDSVPGLLSPWSDMVRRFEVFSVAVFTVEYLLRVWSSTSEPEFAHPVYGRLRFARTPLALVDLVAIAPFYLPWVLPSGLLFLRVLRLVRLLRVYKFGRYSEAPRLVIRAVRRRRAELLAAVFILLLLLVSMASLLYLAENPGRPDVYSSIPESMWWSILALTGNGQVAPITVAGRLIASVIAIIGVGLFAVPAGLLASSFTEELGGGVAADKGVGDPDVEKVTERVVLANAARRWGEWEPSSITADYDPSALIITPTGYLRGPEGGVTAMSVLRERFEGARWHLDGVRIVGPAALLHWGITTPGGETRRSTETLVVRNGLIQMHFLHQADGWPETYAEAPEQQ
jgi:voltage-gated potassium channel